MRAVCGTSHVRQLDPHERQTLRIPSIPLFCQLGASQETPRRNVVACNHVPNVAVLASLQRALPQFVPTARTPWLLRRAICHHSHCASVIRPRLPTARRASAKSSTDCHLAHACSQSIASLPMAAMCHQCNFSTVQPLKSCAANDGP